MEFVVLGWPDDGATLRLDHERFSYAGKFVMSNTGKAVAREDGDLVGAIAFNEDRTEADACWIRYVTVRDDRRGEGIGARLAAGLRQYLLGRDYETVRIAVNNPFAYRALYKAGFCFTGRTTGLAELVLEAPCSRTEETYRDGMSTFRTRDLTDAEERLLSGTRGRVAPERIEPPAMSEA
ncbi:MAG: GNAT superfamily N-acetyltransferase [Halobacteriales archaeon]|jgi:GNAT superfamily N-acetyltransferase